MSSDDGASMWDVEGISYLSICFLQEDLANPGPNLYVAMNATRIYTKPGIPEFDTMSKAIGVGLKILRTEDGRRALCDLGRAVVQGWKHEGRHSFEGDPDMMPVYVDHFLARIKADFPVVGLSSQMLPGTYAVTQRMPAWGNTAGHGGGHLLDFRPKSASFIYYNYSRTAAMVKTYQAGDNATYSKFLVQIATTTSHELAHTFTGYLARGLLEPRTHTPLEVQYFSIVNEFVHRGEAGRWLENRLFGGALAWLTNPERPDDEAGHAYLFCGTRLYRINPAVFGEMVLNLENALIPFPFRCIGEGQTIAELAAAGSVQFS